MRVNVAPVSREKSVGGPILSEAELNENVPPSFIGTTTLRGPEAETDNSLKIFSAIFLVSLSGLRLKAFSPSLRAESILSWRR